MFIEKLKHTLITLYKRQGGSDWPQLARAINWRVNLSQALIKRSTLTDNEKIAAIASLTIQRQIEDELELYQTQIQALADELQNGEIDNGEFEERLEALTLAIFLLAFLGGSQTEAPILSAAALAVLNSSGQDAEAVSVITTPAYIEEAIPEEEARDEIETELIIAVIAAAALATSIRDGTFEENQEGLLSRLIMWVTTALGVYGLGQIFNPNDPFLEWLWTPLKAHCTDCNRLNGQVHTSSEWRASGWRPQSRGLECNGYRCGCGLYDSAGPGRGSF